MEHYIVPFDFEPTGNAAFTQAKLLADKVGAKVTLLHVAKDAIAKQKALADFKNMDLKGHVVIGDLLESISTEAEKLRGTLIVMGIRNDAGLQKLFGSTALKVITDSRVPFLTVQPALNAFQHVAKVALVIDTRDESLAVIQSTIEICESQKAELLIIGGKQTSQELIGKQNQSLEKIESVVKSADIKSSTILLEREDFETHLIRYCKDEGVNLISVTYYKTNSTLFSSNFVQRILENKEGIPVLAIGGREVAVFEKFFNNMVCPVSATKVDSNLSRLTTFNIVVLMGVFLITYKPIFAYVIAGDYFIRAFIGGKYSPLQLIAKQIIIPLKLKVKKVNVAPKMFAARLGFLFASATLAFYYLNMPTAAYAAMIMLTTLAFMDAVFNFCVGCLIYNYLIYPIYQYKNR